MLSPLDRAEKKRSKARRTREQGRIEGEKRETKGIIGIQRNLLPRVQGEKILRTSRCLRRCDTAFPSQTPFMAFAILIPS